MDLDKKTVRDCAHLHLDPRRFDGARTVCRDCDTVVIVSATGYASGAATAEQLADAEARLRESCPWADVQDRINRESAAQIASAEATGSPVAELAVAAGVLALSLFQCKALPCAERRRCLDEEVKRLKGYPQLPPNSSNRAWSMFDPQKLCNHCRPYWYAEMAAAELRHCAVFEAENHADREGRR